jgi:hypothetical protein
MTSSRPVKFAQLIGPLAAAVLCACAEVPAVPPATPAPVVVDEQDLPSLLPGSVDVVLSIDLVRVRASRFAAPLVETLRAEAGPLAAGGRNARGFDEVADVDRFVFARFGPPGGERATLELCRGRFDQARVEQAFRTRYPDARPTQFGKAAGITSAGLGLTFLSPRVLAFGPPWALRAATAVLEGRAVSARAAPWLLQAQNAMPAKLRARGPAAIELVLRATSATRAELEALLETEAPLEHLAARIELGEEARAYLVATGKAPEDAAAMAERLREGLLALRGRPSIESLGLGPVIGRATVASLGPRMLLELGITGRDRALVARKLASLGALLAGRRAAEGASPAPLP